MDITNPRRFITCLTLVFFILATLFFWLAWGGSTLRHGGEVVVAPGLTAKALWQELVNEGYTRRTTPWRLHEWRLGAATRLQAGTYHLEKGESVRAVIGRLMAGESASDQLTLTFPEGFTLKQIAERTAAHGIGSAADFVDVAVPEKFTDDFGFLKDLPQGRTLEGYLFPDTYHAAPDDTAEDIIRRLLANFADKLSDDLKSETAAKGRSLDQIVIMASIIEREVISDNDMALISGILWKRFDDGTGLDADATVRYALNKAKGALTREDLAVESAYNTRKFRGLPPGPISNPGLRALVAAVQPEESDYYYYLSTPSGTTIFSKTNEEHNQNKARYLQ